MATPRRRSPSSEFSSENAGKSSDILVEENSKASEKIVDVEQPEEKPEIPAILEITPTEARPPTPPREVEKREVVLDAQPPIQQKIAVSRHPRNIPKFSKMRG
jgi:hypothetical protein